MILATFLGGQAGKSEGKIEKVISSVLQNSGTNCSYSIS